MDIKTLHDAGFGNLTTAKTAFDTLATAFGQHVENWQHDVVDRLNHSEWTGTAAGHATTRIQTLHDELHAAQQEIGLISRALHDAAEGFAAAQAHLISALDDAKAQGLTVAPDGGITWDNDPNSLTFAGHGAPEHAKDIRDRISAALTEADHADRTISKRLAHFTTNASNATGLDSTVATNDTAAANALEQVPAAGTDPNSVQDWWNGLTDEQQRRMILNHPDQIGNLDGIPATGRDQANRINLQRSKDTLQRQLDALGPEPDMFSGGADSNGIPVKNSHYDDWKKQHDDLVDQMNGINAIEKRLNTPVDDAHPPTFLLGFDNAGHGHAIVAVNNPDTATNVSTYVPGTGARLGSISGDIDRSDAMVASANAANRKAGDFTTTTSSITWVGYDAPQNLVPQAADDTYAKNAEDKLHGFEVGLHATHQGNIANNTILGHSYGTTTIGYTMKDKGLPVDNVVLIASPGAGVDTARDLHIDPSHVYAAQSQADMIGMAGAVDPGGLADNFWDNLKGEYGFGDDDHHLIHGRQTTVPEFGANVLPTDPNAGHSDYWNNGSPTLAAMGQVIAGR
ncbi:alpha/beta hydrolase [Kitasatospora sp. NPDC017646]|uniref:alpha/beta hydrolase n=1 Tax=Kitasatospora sp. NPDC017646 TaxID=3364024 RepID=UPI0037A8E671